MDPLGHGASDKPHDPREYLLQSLVSEIRSFEKTRSGQVKSIWKPRAGYGRRNHWWDSTVYSYVAGERISLPRLLHEAMAPVDTKPKAPPVKRSEYEGWADGGESRRRRRRHGREGWGDRVW